MMEKSLLMFLILIDCVSPELLKLFHFISAAQTQDEAQLFCRRSYTDLASLESVEELKALDMDGVFLSGAWIGLRDSAPTPLWHWALADPRFYTDGKVTTYRNWAQFNPDTILYNDCAIMTSTGLFKNLNCLETYNFICYDEFNADEPYVYIKFFFTWRAAQDYCQDFYSDLVSVRSVEENLRIQKLIPTLLYAYIGLFKDSYAWSDGSESSLRNWDLLQPDFIGACVSVTYDRSWKTELCGKAKPFFCHHNVEVTKRQILRLELKSGLNINDPAVKTLLLSKMEQRLQTLGMKNFTKVEWKEAADGTVFQKISENQTKISLQRKKK